MSTRSEIGKMSPGPIYFSDERLGKIDQALAPSRGPMPDVYPVKCPGPFDTFNLFIGFFLRLGYRCAQGANTKNPAACRDRATLVYGCTGVENLEVR
jgi:hypothetical protein